MTDTKKKMSKASKITAIVIDVISAIFIIFAVILVTSSIISSKKGYTSVFGYAYYTVASSSMDADKEDSFAKGDIIYVKLMNAEQKQTLKEGDVITFWDSIAGQKALNTHRIIEVIQKDGKTVSFRTKGDANIASDVSLRPIDEVQGKYVGKTKGFGKAIIWLQSKTGFLVAITIPSVLLVLYCVFLVVKNVLSYNQSRNAMSSYEHSEAHEKELRDKIREELMKEMQKPEGTDGEPSDTSKKDGE